MPVYKDDVEALSEAKNYLLIFSADHSNPNVAPCAADQIAAIDRAIARLKAAESERAAAIIEGLEEGFQLAADNHEVRIVDDGDGYYCDMSDFNRDALDKRIKQLKGETE